MTIKGAITKNEELGIWHGPMAKCRVTLFLRLWSKEGISAPRGRTANEERMWKYRNVEDGIPHYFKTINVLLFCYSDPLFAKVILCI